MSGVSGSEGIREIFERSVLPFIRSTKSWSWTGNGEADGQTVISHSPSIGSPSKRWASSPFTTRLATSPVDSGDQHT